MSGAGVIAPPGYERFSVRDATVVTLADAVRGVQEALSVCRTLHAWASTLPSATAHQGRATAWGARLPRSEIDVVVRHSQHGGMLAAVTGDLFRWPGRAPWELEVSRRLRHAEVATPEVVAYLVYPAGPLFCRNDVATRRLPDGEDLPAAWRHAPPAEREAQLEAVIGLLHALRRAGAHHPDLNAKNIYLAPERRAAPRRTRRKDAPIAQPTWTAFVLDVDRVRFIESGDDGAEAARRNAARLRRSLLKWRAREGLPFSDAQLERLDA